MLNQVVLVGRLVNDPEKVKEGKEAIITLEVNRSFKNEQGEYEIDFIDCVLWNGIAINTSEYCRKGDVIGVKGRLQTKQDIDENGKITNKTMYIVAEKVTFLSSKKADE